MIDIDCYNIVIYFTTLWLSWLQVVWFSDGVQGINILTNLAFIMAGGPPAKLLLGLMMVHAGSEISITKQELLSPQISLLY